VLLLGHRLSQPVTLDEAGKIAVLFMVNDIENNQESLWTKNTKIYNMVTVRDNTDNVTGYVFELKDKEKYNGYIIISGNYDNNLIHEYSYTSKPLFYSSNIKDFDSVLYTSPLEFYMVKSGKTYTIDGKLVDSKKLSNKFKHDKNKYEKNKILIDLIHQDKLFDLNDWICGYSGQISGETGYGGIYDPYTYVNDKYGPGWVLYSIKTVSGVTPHLMSEFEYNANNCSLTAITTIFEYYRNTGFTRIPSTVLLYADVRSSATSHGYTPSTGTLPTVIDNIVNDLWLKYSYNWIGINDYWQTFSDVKTEIDNNRPLIASFVSGYYTSHSVTVVGYRVYINYPQDDVQFLKVYDGWTTSDRYIDWYAMDSAGSFTKIMPNY